MPLGHALSEGLTVVPLTDMPPSRFVIAWRAADTTPLIRSFVRLARAVHRTTDAAGTATRAG
jgi:hypothetical protein